LTQRAIVGEIARWMSHVDERQSHAQAVARNQEHFRDKHGAALVEGSPHLKHANVREFCTNLALEAWQRQQAKARPPSILDMGAGDGALTLPFLKLGAHVVAADASEDLLADLKRDGASFGNALRVLAGDIMETLDALAADKTRFDIIGASSFLHHIPDYLGLCRRAIPLLAPGGVFFTVQDPLRYDTLSRPTYVFDRVSYFGWRSLQGDYIRGIKTRFRRLFGIYRDDLAADTAEYHVVRNGVDHLAIKQLFENAGLRCEIRPYWSTQSGLFQRLGDRLKLNNTFAVIAHRPD
jgi:2-polyprenyl-3-methyl-5-hydroxy-6-metoxy-1,4-benzoquinol methylase